ncbi:MAG: EI24 domain-containing protein [Candidatus Kapaibacterium sp.]
MSQPTLIAGLTSHFRAFRLLTANKEIRRLAAIPFLINVVLFFVCVPLAIWWGIGYVDSLFSDSSWWVQALSIVAQIIATLVLIVVSVFLFTLIGTIIAGPFAGPLSEAVERYEREKRGLPQLTISERGIIRDAGRSILYAIGRLLLFILIYPFIFATQFIPVVGVALHPILAFLYAAFVLSVDFSDPTLDRYIDTFKGKLRYVWNRKGTYLGFGGGAFVMMLIPFVNLAVIPVCVIAATMLYVEGTEGDQFKIQK